MSLISETSWSARDEKMHSDIFKHANYAFLGHTIFTIRNLHILTNF